MQNLLKIREWHFMLGDTKLDLIPSARTTAPRRTCPGGAFSRGTLA